MNIQKTHIYTILAAATLMLSGCSTSSTVVTGDTADTQVVYNDPVTQKRVQVLQVTDSRENGLMRAVVTIQNQTNRNLQVQYRFRWMDASGIQLSPSNDVYLTRILEGQETATLHSMAPSPQAVEYRFNVTKANDWERGPNSF